MEKPVIGLIGLGRVGTALGLNLLKIGYLIAAIYDSDPAKIKRFELLSGCTFLKSPQSFVKCDLIFIAVVDSSIHKVAIKLNEECDLLPGTHVVHTSGASGFDPLLILQKNNVKTGCLHPLLSFPSALENSPSFQGVWFGIEGEPEVLVQLENVVKEMQGNVFRISSDSRFLYHAAAVFAGNFPTTLLNIAGEMMMSAGIPESIVWPGLIKLLESVLSNLKNMPPEMALSGPIVRGDKEIIQKHWAILGKTSPEILNLYRLLSLHTLKLASRTGTLTGQQYEDLESFLEML